MTTDEIVAIVPIRFLPTTKHRLTQSLDFQQRQQLVNTMLTDVIKAIGQSEMITRFVIVTSDKDFLISYSQSVFEFHRSKVQGLNEELTEYLVCLTQKKKGHAIIILGDLPLLTGKILDELIRSGLHSNRPVIAKDWIGSGTNVLFLTYPLLFKLQFGKNSFQKHMNELQSKSLDPIIYSAIETALDIDDDKAIHLFLTLARQDDKIRKTNTYRFLQVDEKRSGKVA